MNAQYDEYKKLIDEHILDFLPQIDSKSIILKESVEYSLMASGKRLRPILLLAACEFAGGNINEALPFACAIEYVHTYSLIHDDLPAMDDDDLRRGIPTNHKKYGEGIAILAGDALLNTAYEIMYKQMFLAFDDNVRLKKQITAAYTISKAAGIDGMVAGQAADIEFCKTRCSDEMMEYIHHYKTAALITASIKAGLYLGNANDEMYESMMEYAQNLGMAFQICDDLLDVLGDEETIGKNINSDKKNEKETYVSIHGVDKAKEAERVISKVFRFNS